MIQRIYSPDKIMRHPLKIFREIWRDLSCSKEIAIRLFIRDIKAQYRRSFLGVIWAVITPVAMAAGLVLARGSGVISIGETTLPYTAYVIVSMVLWQTFVESLLSPLDVL